MEPNHLWNHREPWSDEEVATLRFWWGELSPRQIADRLQRKVVAIELKARALGLGSPNQDCYTVRGIAKETGYSEFRIRSAAKFLGIEIARAFPNAGRGKPRYKSKWKRTRLSAEDREDILAFLKKHPDGQYIIKTPDASVWGVVGRPPACLTCKSTERPHYSKGFCRKCYNCAWGTGDRPAACLRCKTTEGRYHGKGLCGRCHRISWGIGGRPDACKRCGKTENQHYGAGHCAHCYKRVFTWGVAGRPEACVTCKSNKRTYHGQGQCNPCYKKRRKAALKANDAAAA